MRMPNSDGSFIIAGTRAIRGQLRRGTRTAFTALEEHAGTPQPPIALAANALPMGGDRWHVCLNSAKRSPLLSREHLLTWLGCINEAIETRRRGSSTRAARCSASPTAIQSSRSLCRLSCTAIARSVTAAAASVSA